MLAKLIAALLQAKAGAISGVFLLGATGALISVSASNGVTTVTITEASPSPSASASPTPSVRPTASPTPTASPSPTTAVTPNRTATTADCSAEEKAIAMQVQRVNSAFSGFHTQLEKLRKDHSKDALEKADHQLKDLRKSATKAIEATRTCKDDDDDEDEDDKAKTSDDKDKDKDKDEHKGKDEDKDEHKSSTSVFTATTASGIADEAIAKMTTIFDAAKAAAATTTSTKKPEETKRPEGTKRPEAARTAKPTETPHRD